MDVRNIMSSDLAYCTPQTELYYVAKMMADKHCGAIPVVSDTDSMKPVGMITDRDIVVRLIAENQNPLEMRASDCMSSSTVCVRPDTDIQECMRMMEEKQIRRLIVTDKSGRCIGMLAQADLARRMPGCETAHLLHDISQPSGADASGMYH